MLQPLISASERLWPDEFPEDCCGEAELLGEDSPDDGAFRGERSPDDLDTDVCSGVGDVVVDRAGLGAAVMAASAPVELLELGGAALGVIRSVLREAGVAASSWSVF